MKDTARQWNLKIKLKCVKYYICNWLLSQKWINRRYWTRIEHNISTKVLTHAILSTSVDGWIRIQSLNPILPVVLTETATFPTKKQYTIYSTETIK